MDMKSVQDLKAFLPAENHPLAKQFYLDLIPAECFGTSRMTGFRA